MLRKILKSRYFVLFAVALAAAAMLAAVSLNFASRQAMTMRQLAEIRKQLEQEVKSVSQAEALKEDPVRIAEAKAQLSTMEEKYAEAEKGEISVTSGQGRLSAASIIGILLALTITLVLEYLRPSEGTPEPTSIDPTNKFSEELANLRKLITAEWKTRAGFDKEELLSSLRSSVAEDLADELEVRFKPEAKEHVFSLLIKKMYRSDCDRLSAQISLIRRRGNLNLALGIAITLFAAGVLVWALPPANSVTLPPQNVSLSELF